MNPNFEKPFTFDRAIRLLIGVAIFVFSFLLIKKLTAVLLPFLVAWIFAYMIYPLVKFFQFRLKMKYRMIAVILALISIFGTIALIVWLMIPLVKYEFSEMRLMINEFINDSTYSTFAFIPKEWVDAIKNFLVTIDLHNLFNSETFINFTQQAYPKLLGIITSSFNFIISLFIVFIVVLYLFFILIDYESVEENWVNFVPEKYRNFASHLSDDLRKGMNRYFRGQTLIALIVGILLALGLKIVDFPLGISLGLFLGVLNLVPYLQTLGLFPMILLAAIKAVAINENFFIILLPAVIVMVIVEVIQDTILTPKIMGKATGLKPAVILLSLSIWGSLLGIVGMIIALPITTLIFSYYQRFILCEEPKIEVDNSNKVKKDVKKPKFKNVPVNDQNIKE
jgi:predicted PurR-regulated permease PerM